MPEAENSRAGTGLDADEILDVVDERDEVVGQARRGRVYAEHLRHRCTFILARTAGGRYFVHRRTARKLAFPRRYDMFVGGVVGTGESYDEAALREAEEELGVSGLPAPERLFKFLYRSPDGADGADGADGEWWCTVYRVECPEAVRPQVSEVEWHAFLTEEELLARIPEWDWVPDGLAAWQRLRAGGLRPAQ
jgi:isopentenyldiphosphate isomerase